MSSSALFIRMAHSVRHSNPLFIRMAHSVRHSNPIFIRMAHSVRHSNPIFIRMAHSVRHSNPIFSLIFALFIGFAVSACGGDNNGSNGGQFIDISKEDAENPLQFDKIRCGLNPRSLELKFRRPSDTDKWISVLCRTDPCTHGDTDVWLSLPPLQEEAFHVEGGWWRGGIGLLPETEPADVMDTILRIQVLSKHYMMPKCEAEYELPFKKYYLGMIIFPNPQDPFER